MALTTNKNYLQPSGFKVIIGRRDYPNLEYFAQSVVHPGASVNPLELPGKRVTSLPMAGDKITYGELSIEIILDEDMQSYKEMQSWLERIVNDGQVTEQQSLTTDKVPTYADITLSILTSHNNESTRIRYHDCVPTNIGSIQLSSNVSDVAYITYVCGFRFSTFEIL